VKTSYSSSDLYPYIENHGSHCMAHSSLEKDFEYFVVEGMGYIAYISFRHPFWSWKERKVVLADPLCDVSNYDEIIKRFIAKYNDVIFVQSSLALADVLKKQGYQVNQFGVETELDVQHFSLAGKQRSKLRQWRNKCQREGVEFKEKGIADCQNHQEIRQLSDSWLKNKGGKEYSFLTRSFRYTAEKGVRNFWAYQQNKLIAFAVFDPLYSDGKIVAYYHNIDRISDNAPHGVSASLVIHAIEVFKQEGIEFVSLGMSPLSHLTLQNHKHYDYNHFTRDALRYAYDNLNFIYPFKGNASHKKKFNGVKKPVFFSSTRGNSLWEVFVMMKAIGLF